jgi:hypothetical protein
MKESDLKEGWYTVGKNIHVYVQKLNGQWHYWDYWGWHKLVEEIKYIKRSKRQ